jgi:hypothetical protein
MRNDKNTDRRGGSFLRALEDESSLRVFDKELHPFSGHLVDGRQAANWLIDSITKSDQPVDLCSAFLRSEALQVLLPKRRKQFAGRILVRWQLGDLLTGASDLKSYAVAKDLGFKLFIRQDFHGKVFSVPGVGVVVGSANATLAGFGLKEDGNAEVCTLVSPQESNSIFINGLFIGAVEIDDILFAEINKALLEMPLTKKEYVNWPEDLMKKLQVEQCANRFLTSECLVSIPNTDGAGLFLITEEYDRKLLGAHDIPTPRQTVVEMFTALKVHRWLVEKLRQTGGEMYFGSATVELHNALLDDPGAYRREVKILLQVLLSWYQLLPECGILIDRPNHSQRIRLV